MPSTARVFISDTLVIKALNTETGSGGVARDLNKTVKSILLRARAKAPVNKAADAVHRGGVRGTYAASFVRKRQGYGHILVREVWNTAPHAIYVEKGLRSTKFAPGTKGGRWETFSWTQTGGRIESHPGTGARSGRHILEEAFIWSTRKYISVGVGRAGTSGLRAL